MLKSIIFNGLVTAVSPRPSTSQRRPNAIRAAPLCLLIAMMWSSFFVFKFLAPRKKCDLRVESWFLKS